MTDDLISRLMEDLAGEWQEEVQSAMHALASLGKSVVLPLLDAIEGNEPTLRHHAALVLEQLQPQEALPPLIELLTEEYIPPASKLILVRVLVNLMEEGDTQEGLFSLLTALGSDQEAEVRQIAVAGLGKSNSVAGNVELCRLTQDPDETVRQGAQQQLTSRSREKKANGIGPLEPAMLEAAARLLVRSGMFESRKNAITELLTEGEGAARDLLPLLQDAGIKTLQEVTPLLKQINDAKAHMPLMDIVLDRTKPAQHRQIALRSLDKLKSGEPFLIELYRNLLSDQSEEIRADAIDSLIAIDVEDSNAVLFQALNDEVESIRTKASRHLSTRLTPADKSRLGPMLEMLHRHPQDEGRLYLLQGLAKVLLGAPGDHLFVPEIIDLLAPSDEHAFTVALDILEKIVPRAPSAQTSRSLLALLASVSEAPMIEKLLAILVRILPRNSTRATAPLLALLERFDEVPIQAFVLRLLGRIADQEAVQTLIDFANETHPKTSETLTRLSRQLLETLEGTLTEVWLEDGHYLSRPGLVCQCGERLCWHDSGTREELRCETCQEEYVLLEPFALLPIHSVTTPICFCPPCRRKHPLLQEERGFLVCPQSHMQYITRHDTGLPALVEHLALGLCECCDNPQPLELKGDEIVCLRTNRSPKDTQEHDANPLTDTLETPMPTFSVSDSSAHARPRTATRSNRATRPNINTPTTQTRIRSFQLRQALLTDAEMTTEIDRSKIDNIEADLEE